MLCTKEMNYMDMPCSLLFLIQRVGRGKKLSVVQKLSLLFLTTVLVHHTCFLVYLARKCFSRSLFRHGVQIFVSPEENESCVANYYKGCLSSC